MRAKQDSELSIRCSGLPAFNRADCAIVRRMTVEDFEASAFHAEAAWSKSRKGAACEYFAPRGWFWSMNWRAARFRRIRGSRHNRLGADQVVRHRRDIPGTRSSFLDGAFHADQGRCELISSSSPTARTDGSRDGSISSTTPMFCASLKRYLIAETKVRVSSVAIVQRRIQPPI